MTATASPPGIAELVERHRRGLVSPVETIEASLALAEAWEPFLGAFVTIAREQALAEARALETRLKRGEPAPALAGVPVTVKDIIATAGIRTTAGSPALARNMPSRDAVNVARLRAAGAIVIGKTATPQFACRQTTDSPLSGIARNPWDLRLTPGGSSGGSAAATAAGAGLLSLVTDGGGSARLPAACTGIAGFKPTFGRMPFDGSSDAFGGLGHAGLMARTAADIAYALPLVEGPCDADPYSLAVTPRPARQGGTQALPLAGLTIGWRAQLAQEPMEGAIAAAFERALGAVAALGAQLIPIDGAVEPPLPIWRVLQHSIWAERYADNAAVMAHIDRVIADGIADAGSLTARHLQGAMHGRTRLFRQVQGWFRDCDLILSPTLARGPLAAGHPGYGPIDIDGREAGDIREAWAPLLGLFTMTGHPALSINIGWTPAGLPIGLHLVGRWHEDARVLAAGAAIEAHFDAVKPPPPLPSQPVAASEPKETLP
ncbi:amidase [Bosea sp. (in: a-proteobacteria)]|uniref:amidase n=1 Tax=Bosea sp. (in: a-proteobacteria) TaxID=1871050 RepID=UPI0026266C36|nr:amidase [Bosea sp. (in: a-proteobacteria)]MCO5093149.1 amidase [Bosea sp. (in: a-proteobacteria)]